MPCPRACTTRSCHGRRRHRRLPHPRQAHAGGAGVWGGGPGGGAQGGRPPPRGGGGGVGGGRRRRGGGGRVVGHSPLSPPPARGKWLGGAWGERLPAVIAGGWAPGGARGVEFVAVGGRPPAVNVPVWSSGVAATTFRHSVTWASL